MSWHSKGSARSKSSSSLIKFSSSSSHSSSHASSSFRALGCGSNSRLVPPLFSCPLPFSCSISSFLSSSLSLFLFLPFPYSTLLFFLFVFFLGRVWFTSQDNPYTKTQQSASQQALDQIQRRWIMLHLTHCVMQVVKESYLKTLPAETLCFSCHHV
jgi:hypothetical protein